MSNMKGRVARTIEVVLRHPPILALDMEGRVSADWIAHEVLRAMREPTQEMLSAGHMVENDDDAISNWKRMIDAALKD